MATLGKIRKHSALLVVIIGVALAAFILGDFLTGNNRGQSQEPIAEVFGEKISYRDFDAKLEQQRGMIMSQNPGYQFNGAETFRLQNSVYDQMVKKIILNKEYKDLGLAVSKAELAELFYGKYAHSYIRQLFTDSLGAFDPARVQMYIENIDQQPVEAQQQWKMIEDAIYEERYNSKYLTLINKGYYIPKAFVERLNVERNKKFTTEYIGLKYSTISDSTITVTDEEIKKYYDEHAYQYVYNNRNVSLEFVVFDILPSVKDYNFVKTIIDTAYTQLASVSNSDMSSFIYAKSDMDYDWDSSYVVRKNLPVRADTLFNAAIGTTVAPYIEDNVFYMHKLMDRKAMPDSLKAAHILIAYQGARNADPKVTRTKEQAKSMADSLLSIVNKMDSVGFAKAAGEYSNDPSAAQNGGYLGWFTEGSMVPAFNKACLDNAAGSFTVAETDFGFHIIKVLDKTAAAQKIKLATIQRKIEPSKETSDSIYAIASKFASESSNYETFDKLIIDNNYNKHIAQTNVDEYTIQGINEGREIIRWAFDKKTEKGSISSVFDLAGEYKNVVVYLKARNEKGQAEFEDVKEYIEPFVKKEKIAEKLMAEMNTKVSGVTNIAALSSKLNLRIDTADVAFGSYNLQGYGPELKVIADICNQPVGKISKPLKGESAIFVVNVSKVTEAGPANIEQIRYGKVSEFQSKVNYELFKALEDKADITDNRILYF